VGMGLIWKKASQEAKGVTEASDSKVDLVPVTKNQLLSRAWDFLEDDVVEDDVVDEKAEKAQYSRVMNHVQIQSLVIIFLVLLVLSLMPVLKPAHLYVGRPPEDKIQEHVGLPPEDKSQELFPLAMPNHTDQAILSWAATGITELMTFGFGDFDQRILAQRTRFTDEGWTSFTKSIRELDLRNEVKSRQLVLTTVPSDTPLITSKGLDTDERYKWVVEMPIIETYATNNNVNSRKREIVQLTIVRVPAEKNISGIGIRSWIFL
jgi:hypothetical protein